MAQEVAITPVLGTNAFGTGCGQDLWRFVLPGVWKTGDPRFNVLERKMMYLTKMLLRLMSAIPLVPAERDPPPVIHLRLLSLKSASVLRKIRFHLGVLSAPATSRRAARLFVLHNRKNNANIM